MAVKKKASPSIQRFIDKGADVKASKDKDFKNILVRIPRIILTELDERIEKRPWLNRTQWILEAIHEKLRANSDEGSV
jgi:hypothetical protein